MTAEVPTVRWTVAYRKTRANRFLRVDGVSLDWDAATELAADLLEALGEGHQVYYVPTLESEQMGLAHPDDIGCILTDTGRRVEIREGGVLPEDVIVTVEATATPDTSYMGQTQKEVLRSLKTHGPYPGGFVYGSRSHTVKVLETLVRRGLVAKVQITRLTGADPHSYDVYTLIDQTEV